MPDDAQTDENGEHHNADSTQTHDDRYGGIATADGGWMSAVAICRLVGKCLANGNVNGCTDGSFP